MAEHVITEDGISDLRSMNQIHLQKSGLEVALLGLVVFESIEQERGCGLNHVLGHEDINDLRASCLVNELKAENFHLHARCPQGVQIRHWPTG